MPTRNNPASFEESLLQLRFIGDGLESRSIPIYELGTSLIAVQRIINKAYLYNQGRLEKAARPSEEERGEVSLQIGSRKNASDGYGLIPILQHPIVAPLIVAAVQAGLTALWAYIRQDVDKTKPKDLPANQVLIAAIYPEVHQLAERIGEEGKVNSLEIASGQAVGSEPLLLQEETKRYVRDIQRSNILGVKTTIEGYVRKLFLSSLEVEIRALNRAIKVRLKSEDFVKLKEVARKDKLVAFTGHPLYHLGAANSRYREFTADSFTVKRKQ